jgi:hypothetical protein
MLSSRPRRAFLAWFAALVLVAAALPVAAGNGNNGTVKIHSGAVGDDTHPEVANEPHVTCPFHIHFFFGDAGQDGIDGSPDWWIAPHPPGGSGTAQGDYIADGNGEYSSGTIDSLGPGHYKLYFRNPDGKTAKHKVFWVDEGCDGGGGGGGGGGGAG